MFADMQKKKKRMETDVKHQWRGSVVLWAAPKALWTTAWDEEVTSDIRGLKHAGEKVGSQTLLSAESLQYQIFIWSLFFFKYAFFKGNIFNNLTRYSQLSDVG